MNNISVKFILLLVLTTLSCKTQAHEFTIITSGNTKAPSVEACRKMGVSVLWFYTKLPRKFDKNGKPVNSKKMDLMFKRFKDSDIILIPLIDTFREKSPLKNQVSRFGKKPHCRCFSQDNSDIIKRIKLLIVWLKQFKNFGGLCIDDEPGIQPGGCICENCVELFKKTNSNIPAVGDYRMAPKGIIPENNPVLKWDEFQKYQLTNYYTSIAKAIKSEHPELKVLTIPAAAYFSGKQLSIPGCTPKKFVKSRRCVSLDNCHIRDFQLYVQFYMNEIDSSGWKNKIADGLCIYMVNNGVPNFPNIPVHDKFEPTTKPAIISISAFKRFILQTFSEGAKGIVYFAGRSLSARHVDAAADIYKKYILPVCKETPRLIRAKGEVAVLYSTTTRTFADMWKRNPLERYKHLHECDALAYYLFRKGIPFEMLLEDEVKSLRELKRFSVIISSGLDYLRADKAKLFKEYVKNGGKLITDQNSHIDFGEKANFDASSWYRAVTNGNQRESDMEYQAGSLGTVLDKYFNNISIPCKTACRHLNLNYLTDGKDLYVFIVTNCLDGRVSTEIYFNKKYNILDVIENKKLKNIDKMQIKINSGELKVIKLASAGVSG